MATAPINEPFSMTIAGKGEFINARSFEETFKDTLDLLQELDRSVSGLEAGAIEWEVVDASVNSPLTIKLVAKPKVVGDYSPRVIDAFIDGIEALERRAEVPRYYTPAALKALKRVTDHFGNGVSKLTYQGQRRRVSPSHRVGEHLSRIVEQPKATDVVEPARKFFEQGTIEGTVESLIGHDQFYFNLYDSLSGKRVRCDFHPNMNEDVRAAWQKRVTASGIIRYGTDGKVESMRVDRVVVKPGRETLPQFKGTYINITGGIDPAQYVRGLRDAD